MWAGNDGWRGDRYDGDSWVCLTEAAGQHRLTPVALSLLVVGPLR